MNRRAFISLGVAAMVPLSQSVAAFAQSSLILESNLTGAALDFSDTNYEFVDHGATTFADGGATERIEVRSDLSTLCIHSSSQVPPVTSDALYAIIAEAMNKEYGAANVEDLGLHDLDDGAWMAFRMARSRGDDILRYVECQMGAFPQVDMLLEIMCSESDLEAAFEEAQQVMIAGMPPFLFMEDSGVLDGLFAETTTITSQTRGSRSTRTTDTTSSIDTSNTTTVTAMSDEDVIQAVRDHQAQFHEELVTFDAQVQAAADDDADSAEWFTVTLELMFRWSTYPTPARELAFPESLSSLEADYIGWADAIGDMGIKMGQWLTGNGEIDPFIDAMDVVTELDRALSAHLRTLGSTPSVQPVGSAGFRTLQLTTLNLGRT